MAVMRAVLMAGHLVEKWVGLKVVLWVECWVALMVA